MSSKLYSYFTFSALLLFVSATALAMPARRSAVTLTGADGTAVSAVLHGDENFHYYVSDADGSLLIRVGDTLYPAELTTDGRLVKTAEKVLAKQLLPRLSQVAKAQNRISGIIEGTTFPSYGKQKVAVVLVEYQDVKFNLENPLDYFSRMLNEEGFSDYHATGSARDWFIHSSGGLFEPEFDVYGPVTLQQKREYYGGADAFNHDSNPQKMVIEACRQLNADVDFSQYDRDCDGFIDNVFVVYAGRGEASGGSSDCVWPHAWTLSNAEPGTVYSFDGVRLDRYACSNEWELSDLGYGYRPVGIGTFVHEFSHVMGLPDLYSTEYVSGSFTAGAWSAMDYGPYNNDGCTPPQYSAWERAALGFCDIPELSKTNANISLGTLDEGGAMLLPTDNADEFFIIENRQQQGWDEFIPGHGMLLWHIDYDAQIWRSNKVNNDNSHNRVDIVEADGTTGESSRSGDCFPGASEVTALSATTSPALKTWAGKGLGYSLTDISERYGKILLRVNGGEEDIATPEGIAASNVHAGYFTLSWEPVTGAKGYTVRVYDEGFNELYELYADGTSLKVDNLEPSTEYTVTVCAEDGFYGSLPSVPLSVRTIDPTFDYYAPTALDAANISENSFTARWEPMEGASEYFVTVYRQEENEAVEQFCGFDDGAENLPTGWNATSKASYGMAAYSATSAPSLRLSKDGDYIEMGCQGKRGIDLSFWHRGNGTGANETYTVAVFDGNEWLELTKANVVSEKGGATVTLELPDAELAAVRIVFNRPEKGALAVDDVKLCLHGDYIHSELDAYKGVSAGKVTSFDITGLEKGVYFYDVYAVDGVEYTSLRSERIRVELSAPSGVAAPDGVCPVIKVNGLVIEADTYVEIYDLAGSPVFVGIGSAIMPAAGIYIVKSAGTVASKLFISNR